MYLGDRGHPGLPGAPGMQGIRGIRGLRGEIGLTGRQGKKTQKPHFCSWSWKYFRFASFCDFNVEAIELDLEFYNNSVSHGNNMP